MANKNTLRRTKGLSSYFDGKTKDQILGMSKEVILREAFLRTARDQFDNFGIEKHSVEQVRGMVDLLEQYTLIQGEIDDLNFKK